MAQYNQSMNSSIYRAASTLNVIDLAKNQQAFFGSILNTLNHLLVADIIWLQRFSQHCNDVDSLDYIKKLPTPTSLDAVLYTNFDMLKEKREEMDKVIISFISQLTEPLISQPFSYKNTQGITSTKNFGHVLQHFFNHQTHHRGQVSTLLYQQGVDVGVTDLLVNIPSINGD